MRKNLTNLLLAVAFVLFANMLSAQVTIDKVDQRLIDVYGKTRVQQLIAEQPQFMDYMNYYIQNGYQVMYDIPERKLPYFKDISVITNTRTGKPLTESDLESINILLIDIQRKGDEYLTYKVGETGTVVVFIAPNNLLLEYQAYKKAGGQR